MSRSASTRPQSCTGPVRDTELRTVRRNRAASYGQYARSDFARSSLLRVVSYEIHRVFHNSASSHHRADALSAPRAPRRKRHLNRTSNHCLRATDVLDIAATPRTSSTTAEPARKLRNLRERRDDSVACPGDSEICDESALMTQVLATDVLRSRHFGIFGDDLRIRSELKQQLRGCQS